MRGGVVARVRLSGPKVKGSLFCRTMPRSFFGTCFPVLRSDRGSLRPVVRDPQDITSVLERLGKITVTDLNSLLRALQSEGSAGINARRGAKGTATAGERGQGDPSGGEGDRSLGCQGPVRVSAT